MPEDIQNVFYWVAELEWVNELKEWLEIDEPQSTIKRRQLSPNSWNTNNVNRHLEKALSEEDWRYLGRLPGGGKFWTGSLKKVQKSVGE